MVDFDGILASEWFTGASPFDISFVPRHPRICVITGANASGKSLLRKIIFNEYADRNVPLMHFSQAARSRPGIHRAFLYGSEEDQSTGHNSTKTFLDTIKQSKLRAEPHSILFDEPEIGCSDELAAGMGFHLSCMLSTLFENTLECCYIITHNRYLVREILTTNPSHVHLGEYISLRDWVDRPVTPVYDLESVKQRGKEGYYFVEGRINENRESRKNK